MKLYEIAADYENLLIAIENGEIPEEAIADTLESIEALLDDKADNIACLLKNIDADITAIKAEETALSERRKAKEREYDRIKSYLAETLLKAGKTKIETARNKITFRKSESVVIENEAAFIEWARYNHDEFLTYKEPTVNKTAIKSALKTDEKIDGVHIEVKENLQIK